MSGLSREEDVGGWKKNIPMRQRGQRRDKEGFQVLRDEVWTTKQEGWTLPNASD